MVPLAGLCTVLVEVAAGGNGGSFFAEDLNAGEGHDAAVYETPEKGDFEPVLALATGEGLVGVFEEE